MPKKPNFLVFMTDQQQGPVVSATHACHTPHVEALAQAGIRFDRAYTVAAHCCPSRATFMTGLFPSRHGVFNNVRTGTAINQGLHAGVATFAEALKEEGYKLAYTGKWHVSAEEGPRERGWEELGVIAGSTGELPPESARWYSPNVTIDKGEERGNGEVRRPGYSRYRLYGSKPDQGDKGYEGLHDYKTVQQAAEALPRLAEGSDPWFLFCGVVGPHDPFIIPEKYAKMYDSKDVPLPPNFQDDMKGKPHIYQRLRQQVWGQLSAEEVRAAIAHYWGYCTMLDDMFGELLETLDATGVAEDTVVIYLSDHGDYCGAHGLFAKGVPAFDEAYRVPAVVRWPSGIKDPGRTVEEFVSMADFAPTFMELAGCKPNADLSGRSLVPFFKGENPADWPQEAFTQFNGVELYYTQRAVFTKEFKYVFNGFDFDELYDLRIDPYEMRNLAEDPAYAGIKEELVARLWDKAKAENDMIFNGYITVALLPYGPRHHNAP